jgi:selenium metabolism protein YedF
MKLKQTIDARGWECPKPIIETKKLLDTMREGTVLTIVDDKLAVTNLVNFSESMGYQVTCEEKDGVFDIEVTKAFSEHDDVGAASGNLVIQVTSNAYGSESEGLGENLMKAYIYSLTEVAPMPKTLLFINRGAFLTADGSPVLDSLKKLEAEGVEILTCGACINFFELDTTPEVGGVTNMYVMVEKLNNAKNAVIV